MQDTQLSSLSRENFDVIVICAALGPGWGDLPIEAMLRAMNYLADGGLMAITVNGKWLSDKPTNCNLWNDLISQLKEGNVRAWNGLTEVRRQKYRHRRDMRGNWIMYYAIVLRKEDPDQKEEL